MTALYTAEDQRLGRAMSFKLLDDDRGKDPKALARLEHEARLLARIDHPEVVPLLDIGEVGDEPCLLMGAVGRRSLRAWLEFGPEDAQRLDVLLQVGRGLAAAHRAGVAHCNLGPERVRVDDRGQARLIDFEFGRLLDAEPGAWERDQPNYAGDPRYMAPEARKAGRRDAAADQYSFCVLAWEALTGRRPPHDPLAAARSSGPRRRAVLTALARGLAIDPSARWPDVDALVSALERANSAPRDHLRGPWLTALTIVVVAVMASGLALAFG
nr:serine/threonine-protein kinase [Pseudenhygromyxa sp. WMMC2535]